MTVPRTAPQRVWFLFITVIFTILMSVYCSCYGTNPATEITFSNPYHSNVGLLVEDMDGTTDVKGTFTKAYFSKPEIMVSATLKPGVRGVFTGFEISEVVDAWVVSHNQYWIPANEMNYVPSINEWIVKARFAYEYNDSPKWLGGNTILFASNREVKSGIYTIQTDGTGLKRISPRIMDSFTAYTGYEPSWLEAWTIESAWANHAMVVVHVVVTDEWTSPSASVHKWGQYGSSSTIGLTGVINRNTGTWTELSFSEARMYPDNVLTLQLYGGATRSYDAAGNIVAQSSQTESTVSVPPADTRQPGSDENGPYIQVLNNPSGIEGPTDLYLNDNSGADPIQITGPGVEEGR